MEKQLFDRCVNVWTELQQKRSEFKKSIEPLEQELANRRKAFDESIKILVDEKFRAQEILLKWGGDILRKIAKLAELRYRWCYPDEAVSGFDILRLSASDDDSCETFLDETDGPNFDITHCKLTNIEEINDTYIKFYAEEYWGGEYMNGYIKIPIKYFTTNCLADEEYIKSIYDKIDIKMAERKKAEKAKEIMELESKLVELKGEK